MKKKTVRKYDIKVRHVFYNCIIIVTSLPSKFCLNYIFLELLNIFKIKTKTSFDLNIFFL